MSCPKCGETRHVSMKTLQTKADELPVMCTACGERYDLATRTPKREWRLNDAGDGSFRLVELVDGALAAIALTYSPPEEDLRDITDPKNRHALVMSKMAGVLKEMAKACDKPMIVFKQITEEVAYE